MATYENQSLTRSFGLLEILAKARNPMSLAQLSRDSGLDRATAFRLLSVLNNIGYVHKNTDTRKYTLGYKLFVFGSRANQLESIRHHAHPFVKNLAASIGMTVHVATLEGPQAVYLDKIEMPDAAPAMTAVGMHLDAHASAIGKVLLAFRPEEEVMETYGNHPLRRHTERTIKTAHSLLRELRDIRDCGYATDQGEILRGLNSVAAPILNTVGRANVAISVSAPALELPPRKMEKIGERLMATADRVTEFIVSREEE